MDKKYIKVNGLKIGKMAKEYYFVTDKYAIKEILKMVNQKIYDDDG